jgi:ribosomal protein S18 acetylase RimI-like enzyme
MVYEIILAIPADAEELLKVQRLAYRSEAELYNNFDISPLKQTLAEISDQFATHIFLKAICKGKIIGSVRAVETNKTCHIGRLAVHPDMQNKGIGSALLQEIEKNFTPRRYELFAGSKSYKNIKLYQKLGYNIYKSAKYGCGDIEIFYLEKMRESI